MGDRQATGPIQRHGRYVRESVAHPARMLPAITAHAVAAYTQPGDLVLDPMCGIGTTSSKPSTPEPAAPRCT